MNGLYWTNGPMRVRIKHSASTPEADARSALRVLDEFRVQCQRLYVAFHGTVNGRSLMLEYWRGQNASRSNKLSIGTQLPDGEQRIGMSTIAEINFGELFDGMIDGGEFDQLGTKAMLVFMYTLWEETTRGNIADALHVKRSQVRCDLMGDMRHLRNFMVHPSENTKREYARGAVFLPKIWPEFPEDPTITASMVHALMEQLNAIFVEIHEED